MPRDGQPQVIPTSILSVIEGQTTTRSHSFRSSGSPVLGFEQASLDNPIERAKQAKEIYEEHIKVNPLLAADTIEPGSPYDLSDMD